MKKILTTTALGLLLLGSPAIAQDCHSSVIKTKSTGNDIVTTASNAGSFKTLLAAAKAAGLVDALKAEGPITVFAPTDEAFAKLPKGTVEQLLKPENKDKLVDILSYHVVSGKVPFKTAVGLNEATALNEKNIKLSVKNGSLFLNESKVIKNDINTSNGVIHVIDRVLLPPSTNEMSHAGPMVQILATAIDKGVPHFNEGKHGACADIYEIAASAVVMMPNTEESAQKILITAVETSRNTHCQTTRAWTMRKAIDTVLASTR